MATLCLAERRKEEKKKKGEKRKRRKRRKENKRITLYSLYAHGNSVFGGKEALFSICIKLQERKGKEEKKKKRQIKEKEEKEEKEGRERKGITLYSLYAHFNSVFGGKETLFSICITNRRYIPACDMVPQRFHVLFAPF